jgi:Cu+-exporting ATPase
MRTPQVHEDHAATAQTDPVCGMAVDPRSAAGSLTHAGTTYYFCSRHCLEKFQADPGKYAPRAAASPAAAPSPPATGGVKYTCPMHPEVGQDGPGTCPTCGMALEPMTPQAGGPRTTPSCGT